jgi:putative ABC transport system permease protein
METFLQDLRFAVRTLRKRPAFTLVAILTLALGIGANAAVFSVVDSVLLAPLPFRNADRLTLIWASYPDLARRLGLPDKLPVSPGTFYDWKTDSAFEKMAMVGAERVSLTGDGEPEQLAAVKASGELFQVLGTPALAGRFLLPEDDVPGKRTVVVLSHDLWRRRFGGDRNVVGRTIHIDGAPLTVVGVMPSAFTFPRGEEMPQGTGFAAQPDVWMPMSLTLAERQERGNHGQIAVGLLRPGRSIPAAQSEMDAISRRLATAFPETDGGWSGRVAPLREELVGDIRPALLILLAAAGLVLLIACVNVANLLLAQAAERQKEISIRTALGASRRRMVRQLLTESALLALAGGAAGLVLALWGVRAFAVWIPAGVPVSGRIALDPLTLLFALGVTLLAGLLAGLVPAFQMGGPDLAESLREGTRAGSGTARGNRTRSALVIVETALAVLLVVGAGLLIRSFTRLNTVDPGFRPQGVLSLQVLLPERTYPDAVKRWSFVSGVLERLRALPGVTAAGAVSNLPLSGEEEIEALILEGQPRPKESEVPLADFRRASPGYFEAMGIRPVQGRAFAEIDSAQSPAVAVVDETFARTYWPGADPIGKRFHFGSYDSKAAWLTVVGVVGNVRNSGLHVEPRPQVYVPMAQRSSGKEYFVLRAQGDPKNLVAGARSAVFAVDRDQPVAKIRTMETVISESMARRRFNMILLGVFAALALVLAAVGIYGVTSHSVARRTREMGLRMALGAQPGGVLLLVLRDAGALTLIGLATGIVLALVATRLMTSLLFNTGTTDPVTFASVAAALALVSLFAAWVPARRATQVDPMMAMRAD